MADSAQINAYAQKYGIPYHEAEISLGSMDGTQYNKAISELDMSNIYNKSGLAGSLGSSYADNMSLGADGKLYNTGITEQTDKILGESRVFNADKPLINSSFDTTTNVPMAVNTDADYSGANNLYSGTVNGVQTTLGQNDLSKFDPGSVTNAQVDGQLFNGSNGTDGEWGYKEWSTAGNLGLGAGQLGLGIASYFEDKKTADAQRKLLGQQYESNAKLMADRKANQAALSKINIK